VDCRENSESSKGLEVEFRGGEKGGMAAEGKKVR
jgi:hypothetical protein